MTLQEITTENFVKYIYSTNSSQSDYILSQITAPNTQKGIFLITIIFHERLKTLLKVLQEEEDIHSLNQQ